MTATTATWGITYATSTDRPCDGAVITEAMAEDVDAILRQFDLDLAVLQTIPYASLSTGVAASATLTLGIAGITPAFDTVLADTASLSNLSANPGVIQVPPTLPGIYLGGAYGEQQLLPLNSHTPGDGAEINVNVQNDSGSVTAARSETQVSNISPFRDNNQMLGCVGPFIANSTTGFTVENRTIAQGDINDVVTQYQANLFALWISD